MELINLSEFLSLFGCSSVNDCWLSDDCVIDESGIKAKHFDDVSIARIKFSECVKLSFPCSAQALFYWAKGLENQGYFVKELPKGFVGKWLPNYILFRVWCSQADSVKGVGADMPFNVDWVYWLKFSKYWTKKEAVLLIFGLEPNQFKQVDLNENDLAMCEPLYRLLRLPDDVRLRSYDWLNLASENGYLEYAPTPLRDWFEQQSSIEPQAEAVDNAGAVSQIATEPARVKCEAVKRRTRKTNLSRALDSAINTFSTKPSFDEFWQFFQDDKDETGFIHDYTDTHLTWVDTKGKFHDTKRDTIANYLSRIKS